MSIQLVARAKAAGGPVHARDVFERKTVASLAEVAKSGARRRWCSRNLPGGGIGTMPLTPVGAWMRSCGGDFHRFSQSDPADPAAAVERDRLVRTLAAVVDRHDALRSSLRRNDSPTGWRLEVAPIGSVDVDRLVDRVEFARGRAPNVRGPAATRSRARGRPSIRRPAAWCGSSGSHPPRTPETSRREMARTATRGGRGTPQAGRLLVVVHHLVVDGVSWRILVPDLATAWAQIAAGADPLLPAVGTSVRRWSHGLADKPAAPDACRTGPGGRCSTVRTRCSAPARSTRRDTVLDHAAGSAWRCRRTSPRPADHVARRVPRRRQRRSAHRARAGAVAQWRRGARRLRDRRPLVQPRGSRPRGARWCPAPTCPARSAGSPACSRCASTCRRRRRRRPRRRRGRRVARDQGGQGTTARDPRPRHRLRHAAVPEPETSADRCAALPNPQISFNYLGRLSAARHPRGVRGHGWVPATDTMELERHPATSDMPGARRPSTSTRRSPDAGGDGNRLRPRRRSRPGAAPSPRSRELAELWVQALDRAGRAHVARPDAGGSPRPTSTWSPLEPGRDRPARGASYPGPDRHLVAVPAAGRAAVPRAARRRAVDAYTVQLALDLGGAVDAGPVPPRRGRPCSTGTRTCAPRSSHDRRRHRSRSSRSTSNVPWTEVDLSASTPSRPRAASSTR